MGEQISNKHSIVSLVAENNLVKRNDSKVVADKQAISGLPNSREMVK